MKSVQKPIREWKGPYRKWRLPSPPFSRNGSNTNEVLANEEEFSCAILASFGFSYKCIAKRVGIPETKVAYILSKAGIRVSDYRNGINPVSSVVIERCGKESKRLTSARVQEFKKLKR